MINNSNEQNDFQLSKLNDKVCDFNYLNDIMGNKKNLVKEILEVFLLQVPDELKLLSTAVEKADYISIKSLSHTLKSSVSIMGMNSATPILQEMENLSSKLMHIEQIIELNEKLNLICMQAIAEVNNEKSKYE